MTQNSSKNGRRPAPSQRISSSRPRPEVVYQIFPDRWRSGDPRLTPKSGQWVWKGRKIQASKSRKVLTSSPQSMYTFFGGDLEGIRKSLPYLEDLGVTAVYLNPIFAARSTHRYDAVDFFRIDDALGSREDFERFAADLRGRGMKLVLDGVFNHTSVDHPWYLDPAQRRRYYISHGEDKTMMWMGGKSLPKLDTQKPLVQKMILDVIDAWPEADVWRLDAAHLLPQDLLKKIIDRAAPRQIILEDWHIGTHYFEKGLATGVTNFITREALRAFFNEDSSPETLLERIGVTDRLYEHRALTDSWTFLDNHDTSRFITDTSRDRLIRALVLLFTLPGTPMIYHGIEVGMAGRDPHEAREPMQWNEKKWDTKLHGLVRELIALRKKHKSLWAGAFKPLYSDNRSRTLVFERSVRGERAVVGVNDGYHSCSVDVPGARFRLKPGQWRIVFPKGKR